MRFPRSRLSPPALAYLDALRNEGSDADAYVDVLRELISQGWGEEQLRRLTIATVEFQLAADRVPADDPFRVNAVAFSGEMATIVADPTVWDAPGNV